MVNSGLILEGGGMRGAFTAGILDYFIEKDLYFKEVYAVSAGACHACNYISKQPKRSFRVNTEYLKDRRYCSIYSLLTTGDMFGVDMNYNLIPNELDPYDYDTFNENESKLYVVVTNCVTGEAEYLKIKDIRKELIAVRASSSLPLISRMVTINGNQYLDGGIADSIPIRRSIENGNKKNVVILTRDETYEKTANRLLPLLKIKYKKYPKFIKSVENRHIRYNDTLKFIKKEKEKGTLLVLQPKQPVSIGRIEKNKEKLLKLYENGYQTAKENHDNMLNFFKG